MGVSGYNYDNAPTIHDVIKIENNRFIGVKSNAVTAGGLKTLKFTENTYTHDGKECEIPMELLRISEKTNLIK